MLRRSCGSMKCNLHYVLVHFALGAVDPQATELLSQGVADCGQYREIAETTNPPLIGSVADYV